MHSVSVTDIFRRVGAEVHPFISISAEMIVSRIGEDDLGQPAEATFNFLKYSLELKYNPPDSDRQVVEIIREELVPMKKSEASKTLLFPHASKWRNEIIQGKRNTAFISTDKNDDETYINLHQDGGSRGKPNPFLASSLPRTVLSTARYASETPTVLLARREMQNWKFLQLEPSALRQPDDLEKFNTRIRVSSDGAHLPATVYRLVQSKEVEEDHGGPEGLYTELANQLSELVENIAQIKVDKDERRRTLTLQVITRDGTTFPARSLSDGTLRFLALAVLDLDYTEDSLICLEEPENGIHPERIPAIISLLKSIPFDPYDDDVEQNPLRQVIVNTHSPSVVSEIHDDALVYVQSAEFIDKGHRFRGAAIRALKDTWRTDKGGTKVIFKGKLFGYLNPIGQTAPDEPESEHGARKVKQREDLQSIIQPTLFDLEVD
jgi:predicted ATPase